MPVNENASVYDELEKLIQNDEGIKDALIEIQRKAIVQGWTTDEHAERVRELLQQRGVELPSDSLYAFVKDSGSDLTDDELDQVSGGWGEKCNKWKECPGGTGRSCYPHC